MSVADRLREERERLGLSQPEFGALDDASKSTVQSWERGTAYPNARFLAAIAEAGADVRYIVTGRRDYTPPPPLSAEEQVLLERWREASREVRNAALGALLGANAQTFAHLKPGAPNAPTSAHLKGMHFNAGVGDVQVITGDQTVTRTGDMYIGSVPPPTPRRRKP